MEGQSYFGELCVAGHRRFDQGALVLFHLRDQAASGAGELAGGPRMDATAVDQGRHLHHVVRLEEGHAGPVARVYYHVRRTPGAEASDDLERHALIATDLGSSQRYGALGAAERARLGLVVFSLGVGAHVGVAAHPQEQRVGRPGVFYVAFFERPADPPQELLVEAQDVLAPAGTGPCHACHVAPGVVVVKDVLGR